MPLTIMKFYFDDSGSFSVTQPAPHVMLGVLIPERKENEFLSFHKQFVTRLKPEEFKDDEPKGSKLTDQSRTNLFEFLSKNSWIRIAVSLSDSEFNNQAQIQGYRQEQVKLYQADFDSGLASGAPKELVELQRALLEATKGGISDVQFVKGLLLFQTVYALLSNSVEVFQSEEFDSSWQQFQIVFDRQDSTSITPMEHWINNEFMHFIQEHAEPFTVPDAWMTREHPFMTKFRDGTNNRLVLNRIFHDRFQFWDSKDTPGLQYADWIGNTARQVLYRKRDPKYLDIIRPNLVGHKKTRLNLAHIYKADMMGIFNKYKDLLY